VDGLSGFPDAIRAVYPATEVQLCLVHVVRSSLRFVPYKDRRIVAAGLKTIHSAPTEEAALTALEEFRATWDGKYPMIGRSWHQRWTEIVPFLAYASEIRKVIYTTGRSRDAGCPAPPAQIRTCAANAYGSYLEYLA